MSNERGTPRGRVIVISGPSGSGKSTLVRRLLDDPPGPLVRAVSATTRPPRPGEVDGVDYHFLSPEEFAERRQRGEFLECFEVFGRGYWYGTLEDEVAPSLARGQWVVLEIDVHGAAAVQARYPEATTVFVRPSSVEELARRLRQRGTDSPDAIQRRLEVARRELADAGRYQYQVINDDLQHALEELRRVLHSTGDEPACSTN